MENTCLTWLGLSIRNALRLSMVPLTLVLSHNAFAEEAAQQNSETVETIVVTASALKIDAPSQETPQSIEVVTQEDIQARKIQKLDETFRYSAGVLSQVYGSDNNSEWFKVRGFEATTYMDGNRLYKDGFFAWVVEPYAMEQIELVKGPSSILFGESYPGGVVNVVQKKPTDAPQGSFTASVGNLSHRQFGLDISDWANEDGSQRYRLVATYKGEDGVLDYTDNERLYIAPSYTIDVSEDTSLTLLASLLKDDGIPTGGFFPAYGTYFDTPQGKISPSTNHGQPDYDTNEVIQFSLGYLLEHNINDTWSFDQNFNYGYHDLKLISTSIGWSSNLDTSFDNPSRSTLYEEGNAQSLTLDNKFTARWDSSNVNHTFVSGVDLQYFRNKFKEQYGTDTLSSFLAPDYGSYVTFDSSSIATNKREKSQAGLYAQYQAEINHKVIANLGARFDYVDFENTASNESGNVDNTSFNAGLMYLADSGVSPYVSYSESFEVLTSVDPITGSLYKPLKGKQYEVGVKYTPHFVDGYFNLAWFDLTQENNLKSVGTYTTQSGEVSTQGVEVEAVVQATDSLKLNASYTYMDAKEDDVSAAITPKHLASLWADYQLSAFGLSNMTIGSGVRYVGESFGYMQSGDLYDLDGYTIVDVMARYDITKQWQAQFNVSNALDEEYLVACNYGYCYYGDTQRITATVNYNW